MKTLLNPGSLLILFLLSLVAEVTEAQSIFPDKKLEAVVRKYVLPNGIMINRWLQKMSRKFPRSKARLKAFKT